MAMDGKRVLIIDADLRRPSVHTAFGISRETGFTNVVKGMLSLEEAVVPTSYANLYALPSGPLPPDPAEFLNSSHARDVFTEAAAKYDVVILDSTPTNGISDVQVITRVIDGMLLVIALDTTTRQEMQASVHMLRQISAPVIGIVLNRMRFHRGAYGYYGYYSYYGYYNYYTEDRETGAKSRRKSGSKGGSKRRTKVGK
jgi:capsular exopolysaccharide synthesis family protein